MTKSLAILALFAAVAAQAQQPLVFRNQTITVHPQQLSLDAVRYAPGSVVTNTTYEWVQALQIATNGLFSGGTVETNTVGVQQPVMAIITNAAHWVADVKFTLPRGHRWELNGLPVEIERFSARIAVRIEPAAVQALFGASYPGLLFAASTGNYQPAGQVRDGFLLLGAQALAEGAGE